MQDCLIFKAYHGTGETNALSIVRGNFRTPSRQGWLGCGCYFFESDCDKAFEFAKTKYPKVNVIACDILIGSDKVFDITDPLSTHCKKLDKLKRDIEEAIGAANLKLKSKFYWEFEARVLEKICTEESYTLVRACTYTNNLIEREAGYPLAVSKFPNGIELCLKDVTCIKNKQIS